GDALFDGDVGTKRDVRFRLQQSCGLDQEIVVRVHAGDRRPDPTDPTIPAQADADRIAPGQEPEHGLQLVIAVRAAARDPQEQVELGWRRPAGPAVDGCEPGHPQPPWTAPSASRPCAGGGASSGAAGARVQSSTTSRTRASPRLASIPRGISGRLAPAPYPTRHLIVYT